MSNASINCLFVAMPDAVMLSPAYADVPYVIRRHHYHFLSSSYHIAHIHTRVFMTFSQMIRKVLPAETPEESRNCPRQNIWHIARQNI